MKAKCRYCGTRVGEFGALCPDCSPVNGVSVCGRCEGTAWEDAYCRNCATVFDPGSGALLRLVRADLVALAEKAGEEWD